MWWVIDLLLNLLMVSEVAGELSAPDEAERRRRVRQGVTGLRIALLVAPALVWLVVWLAKQTA
jgi:hypothetical protein